MLHFYFDDFYTYTNKFKIFLFKPDPGHLPILEFLRMHFYFYLQFKKRTFRREKKERNLAGKKCLRFQKWNFCCLYQSFFVEPRWLFCFKLKLLTTCYFAQVFER